MFSEIATALTDVRGAEFWVAVSFVIFLGIVWYVGGFRQLAGALDGRGNRIREELDQARKLREEAQTLLAEYQRRRSQAEGEAAGIVDAARAEAERLKVESVEKARDFVARRTKVAEQKIAQAESQAVAEVRAAAADAAVTAATTILRGQANDGAGAGIMGEALREVRAKLS